MLNRVRRQHPALQQLRNVSVHNAEDDSIVAFSKVALGPDGRPVDVVITVINVDPHNTRETTLHLDMSALGLDWGDRFVVHDEVTGQDWTWGAHNYVRLDPFYEPAHILTVRSTSV
jgi:starch synthase (maltosyl-transferring)